LIHIIGHDFPTEPKRRPFLLSSHKKCLKIKTKSLHARAVKVNRDVAIAFGSQQNQKCPTRHRSVPMITGVMGPGSKQIRLAHLLHRKGRGCAAKREQVSVGDVLRACVRGAAVAAASGTNGTGWRCEGGGVLAGGGGCDGEHVTWPQVVLARRRSQR
jgi:hypothetical protein